MAQKNSRFSTDQRPSIRMTVEQRGTAGSTIGRTTVDGRGTVVGRTTVDGRGTAKGRLTVDGRGTVDGERQRLTVGGGGRNTVGGGGRSTINEDEQKLIKKRERSRGHEAGARRESVQSRMSVQKFTKDRGGGEDRNQILQGLVIQENHQEDTTIDEGEPWLHTTRIKLLAIWLPLQLAAFGFLAYMLKPILTAPAQSVIDYNDSIHLQGMWMVGAFAVAMFKDICIFLYFLLFGSAEKGFNNAIFAHMVTIPVDSAVILVISIWGSIILAQDTTRLCRQDEECNEFLVPMTLNILIGYIYVNINLLVKPFLYCCFKVCFATD